MASTPRSSADHAASKGGRLAIGGAALVLLVLGWELLARLEGHELVLPGPFRVFTEALRLYPTSPFLRALGSTFLRGLAAFGVSVLVGGAAGIAAGLSPAFSAALAPCLTVIRATPVLALILVILLWFHADTVPVLAAFLMCFPVMVTSASSGARAADPKLLEMARLFGVPRRKVFSRLRLPAAAPHLLSGARSSLGLSWKVVVAGEVLALPPQAIGSGLQAARYNLETPQVLAWAASAVLLCGLTEWAFGLAERKALSHGL